MSVDTVSGGTVSGDTVSPADDLAASDVRQPPTTGPAGIRPAPSLLSTARALSQFAAVGAVVLIVLAVTGVVILHRLAVRDSVAHARELSSTASRLVVGPAVTDGLAAGDTESLAAFDHLVRTQLMHGRVVRVKLWSAGGRILYSDEKRLIGRQFRLGGDERRVLRTGRSHATLSDLEAPENALDQQQADMLEVYSRVRTPSGQPLLFEVYLREDSVLADSSNWLVTVVPAFVLALLALQALQLPLAWRLVRRVQQGQREKDVLQRRAIEASDHERRRIAGDLHDGLIQQLVSVSLSLSTSAGDLRASGQERAADQLEAAAESTRAGITDLRGLVTDIYPPSLQQLGLRAAVEELLVTAERRGLSTRLEMPADPGLPYEIAAALHRATREAVRNVLRHAEATEVSVRLVEGCRTVGVVVTDDGIGPRRLTAEEQRRHFGLRLLADLATEIGGRLEVAPAAGGGTRFRFELPRP